MVKLQAIPFTIHNQHWNTSWYIIDFHQLLTAVVRWNILIILAPPPPPTHTHTHSKQNRAVSVAVRKPHGYTSKASMKAKFTVIFNSSTPNTAANQVSINTDNGLSIRRQAII